MYCLAVNFFVIVCTLVSVCRVHPDSEISGFNSFRVGDRRHRSQKTSKDIDKIIFSINKIITDMTSKTPESTKADDQMSSTARIDSSQIISCKSAPSSEPTTDSSANQNGASKNHAENISKQRNKLHGTIALGVYIFFLVTMSLSMKKVYNADFRYPRFATSIHQYVGLFLSIFLHGFPSEQTRKLVPLKTQLSLATAHCVSLVARNVALMHADVSFIEMLGALTPVSTLVVNRALIGKTEHIPVPELLSTFLACIGTALCVYGNENVKNNAPVFTSIFACMAAMVARSTRSVWQGATMKRGVEPGDLYTLMSLPMVAMVAFSSLLSEGFEPVFIFWGDVLGGGSWRVFWVVLSALNATVLNLVGLTAISYFGASVVHLIGNVKILLTIWAASFLLDEGVSPQQFFGTILSGLGLAFFQVHRARRFKGHDLKTDGIKKE